MKTEDPKMNHSGDKIANTGHQTKYHEDTLFESIVLNITDGIQALYLTNISSNCETITS